MKNVQKIFSVLALAWLSLQAATVNATVYVSTTQADGVIGASPWSDAMTVHLTMLGAFTISSAGRVSAFFNTDYAAPTDTYFFTQSDNGTVTYDSATQLFTLSNATVRISQKLVCGTDCSHSNAYLGSMNLAFYILGENPTDILSVAGANFITINQVTMYNGQGGDLYSPSRIDLTYQGTVPLPAATWLFGSALCGLVYSKRKARATAA